MVKVSFEDVMKRMVQAEEQKAGLIVQLFTDNVEVYNVTSEIDDFDYSDEEEYASLTIFNAVITIEKTNNVLHDEAEDCYELIYKNNEKICLTVIK